MATFDRLAPPPTSSFPARTAWSPRRAIAAVLTVAAAIALLQVVQSSSFANTGQQMQVLETQKLDSTARVHQLEAEVAALSSLDRIERNARDRLGMIPARNIMYVQVAVPAPEDPLLPRPVLTAPASRVPHPTIWQRFVHLLPL
jgi:cell division protein FtsB